MIGGNIQGQVQIQSTIKNEIGESTKTGKTVNTLTGYIDMSSGDSLYTTNNAKIQESTHIFICDYVKLDERVNAENSRMIVDGYVYDVKFIDNPMNLNKHLEIYLKYTGGQ